METHTMGWFSICILSFTGQPELSNLLCEISTSYALIALTILGEIEIDKGMYCLFSREYYMIRRTYCVAH